MNKKLAVISGIAAAIFAVTSVQATPITGTISMGGEVDLDSSTLSAATTVTSWPLVYVVADSDSFSSIAAYTQVAMSSPWTFNPSGSFSDLWSVGGFEFDLTGDTSSVSGNFLNITGVGTISYDGTDTTAFDWNLSLEEPTTGGPTQFTFSAAAGATTGGGTVPDGGLTVALLGVALAGVEIFRRKICKA